MELNLGLALDNDLATEFENFAPYHTSMDVHYPYEVSGFLSLLPPGNTILTNWLDSKVPDKRPDTIIDKLTFEKYKGEINV